MISNVKVLTFSSFAEIVFTFYTSKIVYFKKKMLKYVNLLELKV